MPNIDLTSDELVEEVVRRLQATPDPRLRQVMISLVRHLHAFAIDVDLQFDEWMKGIEFLTAVGHITDEVRQEFILLSDTLGFSSQVIDLTYGGEEGATEPTVLGPFHVDNAPERTIGDTIAIQDDGEEIFVFGRVTDTDGNPIANAELDVWQNSTNGFYDVQDQNQPAGNMRGRFRSAADGSYWFRTARPVPYPIPDDGPVGKLLTATGRHPWRASHIHFIVSADGYLPITTHVFDRDNEYIDNDTVFGVKQSLIRDVKPADAEVSTRVTGSASNAAYLEMDFAMAKA